MFCCVYSVQYRRVTETEVVLFRVCEMGGLKSEAAEEEDLEL